MNPIREGRTDTHIICLYSQEACDLPSSKFILCVCCTDTYEMVVEEDNSLRFMVSHHYESNVKAAGDVNNASRARRLAQEAVTLSTSLPLAHSSSVFVRCDEDRLDVMKVSM